MRDDNKFHREKRYDKQPRCNRFRPCGRALENGMKRHTIFWLTCSRTTTEKQSCAVGIAYRERCVGRMTLAAELLMPTFLVNAEIERAALRLPNGILYKSASDPNYEKILEMARRIGVSWSAIRIRLQQMQVIKGKPIHCHPLDIIRFGE